MKYSKTLESIFALQDKANRVMGGQDWKAKKYNWSRCCAVETGEMMDHLGYKHWKNITPDFGQAFIEVVDVLHFASSAAIEQEISTDHISRLIETYEKTKDRVLKNCHSDKLAALANDPAAVKKEQSLTAAMKLMKSVVNEQWAESFIWMALCAEAMGHTIEDLLKTYVAKNTLNMFRQNNGDKEGKYPRNWNVSVGVTLEDNQVMEKLLKDNPSLTEDYHSLYSALEQEFKKIYK